MIRWFLRWFRWQPVSLPDQMRTLWGTDQTARVIHDAPDDAKVRLSNLRLVKRDAVIGRDQVTAGERRRWTQPRPNVWGIR